MTNRLILSLLLLLHSTPVCFGQYTYFNEAYLDGPEEDALVIGIFCNQNRYVNFGQSVLENGYNLHFRMLNDTGQIEEDVFIPFPDSAFYLGGSYAFQEYEDGMAWAGGLVTVNESNTGAAMWFDPQTYQLQWSHFFNELNDEQTSSPMSCLRKMGDDTFYIGGNQWHYLDGPDDIGVDEFTTYIGHLDDEGQVIEQWFFDEGNEYYRISDLFLLDNGKLLISGGKSVFEVYDQFLMIFNPETGQIELESTLGSEWSEARFVLRRMPDGEFYGVYDVVISSDGEILYPIETKQCRLRKINPDNLSAIWDVQIPLQDLIQECRGFGVAGFEPTLDSGYVFLYSYASEDLSDGYYQPHIVKLNSDFEVEWVKEYLIETEYQIKWSVDLAVAPDGGFLCTGFALVPNPGIQQIQWTFKTDACGEIEVSDCPAVSVNEKVVDRNASMVFPNPAGDNVSLLLNGASMYAASIEISDMTGRLILTINRNAQFPSIDVSNLSAGSYIVQLKSTDGHLLESLVLIKE